MRETKLHVDRYLQRLSVIDYNSLKPSDKVNYDVLSDNLHTTKSGYKWRYYSGLNPVNFLGGPQIDPTRIVTTMPFNNITDIENYLARLELFPKQIDEIIESFNEAIRLGFTYHNVSIARVPGQIQKILSKKDSMSKTFLTPFSETLQNVTTVSERKKKDIETRSETAVMNVMSSFVKLKTYIENTYMKHLRSGTGVDSYEWGDEFYKECLEWHLSLPLTPEEVHNKGLKEVERIYGKMEKEYILELYNDIIHNRIEKKMPLLFADLPKLPIVVKESPNDGPLGTYRAGTADGSKPGVFSVNLFRPQQMPTYGFMALAIHETNPGHHLQFSVQKTTDLPTFRKNLFLYRYAVPFQFPIYSSFVEGWALYAESLGEEVGLYKDDYEVMGRYGSEMFRACRLVVDTGLHYYNWTREKAIDYLLNYTPVNEGDITNEIDRYITWPGQACSYKIGELKILELRQKSKDELGSKFNIKDFHTAILKQGSIPLSLLEQVVNDWIVEVKTTPQNGATEVTFTQHKCVTSLICVFVLFNMILY